MLCQAPTTPATFAPCAGCYQPGELWLPILQAHLDHLNDITTEDVPSLQELWLNMCFQSLINGTKSLTGLAAASGQLNTLKSLQSNSPVSMI